MAIHKCFKELESKGIDTSKTVQGYINLVKDGLIVTSSYVIEMPLINDKGPTFEKIIYCPFCGEVLKDVIKQKVKNKQIVELNRKQGVKRND